MSNLIQTILKEGDETIFGNEEEKKRFFRRLLRTCHRQPREASSQELMEGAIRRDAIAAGQVDDWPFTVENLMTLAETSPTASGMLVSALYAARGIESLELGNARTAAKSLARAYRTNSFVVRWQPEHMTTALEQFPMIIGDASEEHSVRGDALVVHAHLTLFIHRQPYKAIIQLEKAQSLLPHDGSLHALEGCMYALQQNKPAAFRSFQRAAEIGCDDIEHTLFHRAVVISDRDLSRVLLERFVLQAHPDARKLPEACYRLCLEYGIQGPQYLGAAKRFFEKGLEADSKRLPVFQDEAASFRRQAETLVKRYYPCGNPSCASIGRLLCSSCKSISYCGRSCQVKHWKIGHKAACKKAEQKIKGDS